jgi:2-polyprenyl-3-methyl-5-hydroxy-6-metoxy-1,4-benzoquinol methylase
MIAAPDFDAAYFGDDPLVISRAGYSSYARWHRHQGQDSRGEWWKDKAVELINKFGLQPNWKLLEIGCAKGFLVEDLRELGVNAFGLDVSPHAVSSAPAAVQPFLAAGDSRTALSGYSNREFNALISLRFLCCIPEPDLPALITQMNRISRFQAHVIDETPNPEFYLVKPLDWWRALGWAKGTLLISQETGQEMFK